MLVFGSKKVFRTEDLLIPVFFLNKWMNIIYIMNTINTWMTWNINGQNDQMNWIIKKFSLTHLYSSVYKHT